MRRLGLIGVLLAAGCGSSGGGGTCGQVEPCGGDVVGTWKIGGMCINKTVIMQQTAQDFAFCPEYTVDTNGLTASGTLSFNADLTYQAATTLAGTYRLNLPASCLQGATCAQFDQAIKASLAQDPDPSIQSIACAGAGTCVCTVTPPPEVTNETGTYTTAGSVLTTTGGGSTDSQTYCVQGNTIHFVSVDVTMNMGPMGMATIEGDIVATKQ